MVLNGFLILKALLVHYIDKALFKTFKLILFTTCWLNWKLWVYRATNWAINLEQNGGGWGEKRCCDKWCTSGGGGEEKGGEVKLMEGWRGGQEAGAHFNASSNEKGRVKGCSSSFSSSPNEMMEIRMSPSLSLS